MKPIQIIRYIFFTFLIIASLNINIFAEDLNIVNQNPKISGRILLIFYHTDKTTTNGEKCNNDIYFKNIDIGLKGKLLNYLRYKVSIQLDRQSMKFMPLDAYCAINLFPFGELLVGQFKPPFSMERLISSPKRDFLNSAIATGFVSARDIGIAFMGETKKTEFNFGVLNGTGLNKLEDNTKKDFVSRFILKPLKYTKIGGALYYGWQCPDTSIVKVRLYNFQGEFKNNIFHIRYEYLIIKDNNIHGRDYYIQSGYKFEIDNRYISQLEPVIRFENYDPDVNKSNNNTIITTLGLNVYFDNNYKFRSQINYLSERSKSSGTTGHKFYIGLQTLF